MVYVAHPHWPCWLPREMRTLWDAASCVDEIMTDCRGQRTAELPHFADGQSSWVERRRRVIGSYSPFVGRPEVSSGAIASAPFEDYKLKSPVLPVQQSFLSKLIDSARK